MQPYLNLTGNSGVVAYEIAPDSITIQFTGGAIYIYTNNRTGIANVDEMKSHARAGQGLCTFINQNQNLKKSAQKLGRSMGWPNFT